MTTVIYSSTSSRRPMQGMGLTHSGGGAHPQHTKREAPSGVHGAEGDAKRMKLQ
jgi:hypothetical protein